MREYDVITDTDLDKFKRKVNRRISDGWVCEGGVSMCAMPDGTVMYAQVMRQ